MHPEVPTYLYDLEAMAERARLFQSHLPPRSDVHYAVKANSNREVLQTLQGAGMGADVVSVGELERALECGFAPQQTVFSGVGKSARELRESMRLGVGQINVESVPELLRLVDLAKALRLPQPQKVGLRINPDVSAKTHPHISTGFREHKFGVDKKQLPEVLDILKQQSSLVRFYGISAHIGSQILDMEPFVESCLKSQGVFKECVARGFDLKVLNLGGGLGMDYSSGLGDEERIASFGSCLTKACKAFGSRVAFEPGRIIVGRFGVLLARVEYIKRTPHKNFAILNTGMHHFLRPALYGAQHRIFAIKKPSAAKASTTPNVTKEVYDVVGPICESSDVLARGVALPVLQDGDTLVIADCGAYAYVMASRYNLHPLPKERAV